MTAEDQKLQQQAGRLDSLLEEIELAGESPVRDSAMEAIGSLLELYGEGIGRIAAVLEQSDPAILRECAGDPLVSHLLMLHGVHPEDVETRVLRALDDVRPYLESHGGNVDFLGVANGIAHVELQGTCRSCPASMMTLKLAVQDAVQKAAPELIGVEAAGVDQQITSNGRETLPVGGEWTDVGDLSRIEPGGVLPMKIDGSPAVVLRASETYYAYRDQCPGCEATLSTGVLNGKVLICPACGLGFDVRRAGRCESISDLYLQPLPLIMADESARIAVPMH